MTSQIMSPNRLGLLLALLASPTAAFLVPLVTTFASSPFQKAFSNLVQGSWSQDVDPILSSLAEDAFQLFSPQRCDTDKPCVEAGSFCKVMVTDGNAAVTIGNTDDAVTPISPNVVGGEAVTTPNSGVTNVAAEIGYDGSFSAFSFLQAGYGFDPNIRFKTAAERQAEGSAWKNGHDSTQNGKVVSSAIVISSESEPDSAGAVVANEAASSSPATGSKAYGGNAASNDEGNDAEVLPGLCTKCNGLQQCSTGHFTAASAENCNEVCSGLPNGGATAPNGGATAGGKKDEDDAEYDSANAGLTDPAKQSRTSSDSGHFSNWHYIAVITWFSWFISLQFACACLPSCPVRDHIDASIWRQEKPHPCVTFFCTPCVIFLYDGCATTLGIWAVLDCLLGIGPCYGICCWQPMDLAMVGAPRVVKGNVIPDVRVPIDEQSYYGDVGSNEAVDPIGAAIANEANVSTATVPANTGGNADFVFDHNAAGDHTNTGIAGTQDNLAGHKIGAVTTAANKVAGTGYEIAGAGTGPRSKKTAAENQQ